MGINNKGYKPLFIYIVVIDFNTLSLALEINMKI